MRQWVSERRSVLEENSMLALFASAKKYPDVINLSIGDPDLPTPKSILDAMYADCLLGHTKYTNPKGDPALITALQRFYSEEYGLALGADRLMVTPAACAGMYEVMQAVLDEGDEVLLFDPYFSFYAIQVKAAGGRPVCIPCLAEEGFLPNVRRAAAFITPRTKAMVINTPNNPTGACYGEDTLEALAAFAKEHDLLVISDDIYTDFCYETPFSPIIALPEMLNRTVSLGSFSKNFLMTGMRIGWIAAPPEVVRAVHQISETIIYASPAPSQRAAVYALEHREELRAQIGPIFEARMLYARRRIDALPYMAGCPCKGGFYLFPGIRPTGLSSMEACQFFLDKAHVLMLPGSIFGDAGEGHMRIACTQDVHKLGEAFDRLEKLTF
ncbi:MAG: aminotransferase class I/II-fold pyridoxal phosphate-dependent enzyme [Candidatus Pelethousia sp.]|nr:aminotransferase class I/II-fold pyridoxal phosphate-dependent enzyme [Candidatus Pelethousia sp.]